LPGQYSRNPAVDFLSQPHEGSPEEIIAEYARFLLDESNAYQLPVPLERVQQYFGFSVQRSTLSRDQHGFTTEKLSIFLNADDPPTRQKFTLAHELFEVFFFVLKDENSNPTWMSDKCFTALCDRKERYCNRGAADLILPSPLFRDLVAEQPVSLQWAQEIAQRCEVSLNAALYRIIEMRLAPIALVVWRYTHSPRELRTLKALRTNRDIEATIPPQKMRVAESYLPSDSGFIPKHKSVTSDSSIYQAFREGVTTSGMENLDLVGLRGKYLVESRPFTVENEQRVLSLIHLDVT
jgi:Zn-dependent peptidase ImmA (M78 family)